MKLTVAVILTMAVTGCGHLFNPNAPGAVGDSGLRYHHTQVQVGHQVYQVRTTTTGNGHVSAVRVTK